MKYYLGLVTVIYRLRSRLFGCCNDVLSEYTLTCTVCPPHTPSHTPLSPLSSLLSLPHQAFEKKHRDNLGPHIIEERNRQYLMKMTSDSVEILDPTGRASRVDASKITDIADHAFGLGPKSTRIPPASMKRITENIRQKLKVDESELGEYARFVRSQSAGNGQDNKGGKADQFGGTMGEGTKFAAFDELASKDGFMPGVQGPVATINVPVEKDYDDLMVIASDENNGQAALESNDSVKTKYKTVKLSKLEQDFFETAKGRQQTRIQDGTQQIAGGKVFKGQAFVSHPEMIQFVDFQVGRVYKKRFTLTNTSYTFNSFKLLPLSDKVIDFFDITFDKPGRMSAGVSCTIEIKFTPQLNQDIFSDICFYSETGPMKVPLKCFIKRCIPEIANPKIDFGRIVVGQQLRLPLQFKNIAAKSTPFTIKQIIPEDNVETVGDNDINEEGEGDGVGENKNSDENILPGSQSASRRGSTAGSRKSSIVPPGPVVDSSSVPNFNPDQQDENEAAMSEEELASRVQRRLQDAVRRRTIETPEPLSIVNPDGVVNGYGETTVTVLCAPLHVGEIKCQFEVIFSEVNEAELSVNSNQQLVQKRQIVDVCCTADELPIYVTNENVDLKCTLYGRIYRKRFELRNRSTTACPVAIKIPSPFNRYIEVSPTTVNVQSGGSIGINVKFAPERDILQKLKYFSTLYEDFEDAARLMIPVEIRIEGQELPIFFIIRTDVTTSDLHLSTNNLDFGKVYVSQQNTLQLKVKNACMLPQKLAFVNLKKEMRIHPNEGFAVLLPNEDITFDVSMCPNSALPFNFNLQLSTSSNDHHEVKIRALGVESPVMLENPVIHMLPTTPGEKVVDSFFVCNTTKSRQCIEIVAPDQLFTWLKISPTVVDLQPHARCRLEIEYIPPRNLADLDPMTWHEKVKGNLQSSRPSPRPDGDTTENTETSPSSDTTTELTSPFIDFTDEDGWITGKGMYGEFHWTKVDRSEEECETGVSDDEWGYVGRFHIPIFMKPATMNAITKENKDSLMKQLPPPLYLNLETVISRPEFIADTEAIDFGQMAVGTSVIKTIKVRNLGHSRVIVLRTSGLNAVGPFSVINASREMPPSQWHTILVECSPGSQGLFVEHLELESMDGGPHIHIKLRVQGVNPTVDIIGLDPHPSWSVGGGILDFGDITTQNELVKKFTVRNKSLFTIEATIERALCQGVPLSKQSELIQRTVAGLPIFSCRPESAIIPEGGEVVIEIVFRPDRARVHPYREDFNVLVGIGEDPIKLCATGRCHHRQVFVRTVDPFDEPFYREILKDERDEDVLLTHASPVVRKEASNTASLLGVGSSATPVIALDFPDPYASGVEDENEERKEGNKSQTRAFAVCCAAVMSRPEVVAGKGGKGGGGGKPSGSDASFEYKLGENASLSKYFSMSVDKGNVPVGGEVVVTVTCTLLRPQGLGGLEVGNWQKFESFLTLKGGWKPDGDEDNEVIVPIVLNAYVRL